MLLYDLTFIGLIIIIISLFVGLIYGIGYVSLQSSKKVNIYLRELNNSTESEEEIKIEQENYKKKKDKIITQKFQETVASYNEYYNEQENDGKIVGIADPLGPLSEREFIKRKEDIANMIRSVEEENGTLELHYHDAQHRMHVKAKREREEKRQRAKQQQGYNTHQENVKNNKQRNGRGRSR